MRRNTVALAAAGRTGWIALGLLVGTLLATTAFAQVAPAAAAAPAKSPYVFASDGAAILNFVKADKVADFEMVMEKVKEALAKSEKPERKQQAASWKVFKAAEAGPAGSAIYLMVMDPAVKGADYSVTAILSEAFPTEVQALYKTYSESYSTPSQNILNLTLTQAFK